MKNENELFYEEEHYDELTQKQFKGLLDSQ